MKFQGRKWVSRGKTKQVTYKEWSKTGISLLVATMGTRRWWSNVSKEKDFQPRILYLMQSPKTKEVILVLIGLPCMDPFLGAYKRINVLYTNENLNQM